MVMPNSRYSLKLKTSKKNVCKVIVMKKFSSFLIEEKNTHMEHIEDNVLNGGVQGARESINFLRSLRDMLAGNADAGVNVSVKWDGPAIFAGTDLATVSFL